MPRYLVERTFPDGLAIPMTDQGANVCLMVIGNNIQDDVTWVHSYVTGDKKRHFVSTMFPHPRPYAPEPHGTTCRWIRSPR
jgi:hypothetical protein